MVAHLGRIASPDPTAADHRTRAYDVLRKLVHALERENQIHPNDAKMGSLVADAQKFVKSCGGEPIIIESL